MVHPLTGMLPTSFAIRVKIAQIAAPKKENAPTISTKVTGKMEKLNRVSITSLIFFFSVHLLVPISRILRVYSTYPV